MRIVDVCCDETEAGTGELQLLGIPTPLLFVVDHVVSFAKATFTYKECERGDGPPVNLIYATSQQCRTPW